MHVEGRKCCSTAMKIQALCKTREDLSRTVLFSQLVVIIFLLFLKGKIKYRVVNRGVHCIVTIGKRSFAVS